eukprot:358614-Chlamydomonas_euryale.AAC.4
MPLTELGCQGRAHGHAPTRAGCSQVGQGPHAAAVRVEAAWACMRVGPICPRARASCGASCNERAPFIPSSAVHT